PHNGNERDQSMVFHFGISTPLCDGELMICDGFSLSLLASPRTDSAIFDPSFVRSSTAESVVVNWLESCGTVSRNLSNWLPLPCPTGYFSPSTLGGGASSLLGVLRSM